MINFKSIVFLYFFTFQAIAIDIGPTTTVFEPKEKTIFHTIRNNSNHPKIYHVKINRIDTPKRDREIQPMKLDELLYTPKRFLLSPGKEDNVRFFYNGPTDQYERYYLATFTESSTALPINNSHNLINMRTLDIDMEIQAVIVVRPRQVRFEYQVDPEKSAVTNTGNTYFEFMVKQGCEQPDSEADSKYLLPGETYQNPKIGQAGNQKLIVYQSRFIPVSKDCWPD